MLSAGNRDRQFYTNFPPIGSIPSSAERPNGPTVQDVLDEVHGPRSNFKQLADKAGCFKQSSSSGGQVVRDTRTGASRAFTVEEKEVCLGFSRGYTAITAKSAVEKRIQEFRDGDFFAGDYEDFGFVTLKGCVEKDEDEEEEEEVEEVSDTKRAALLGKSIDLHVLTYILKPLDAVFAPTTSTSQEVFTVDFAGVECNNAQCQSCDDDHCGYDHCGVDFAGKCEMCGKKHVDNCSFHNSGGSSSSSSSSSGSGSGSDS